MKRCPPFLFATALFACAAPRAPQQAPSAPGPTASSSSATSASPKAADCSPAWAGARTFTIESAALGETRRINVFTPPGYAEKRDARFPVLYMPDGGMQEDFPHVTDTVLAGITWETMRPMIVVGIENTERRRDLTGPTRVAKDREIAPRVGGSAAFRKFIRDELMPQIRAQYRTSDETAVIGESLAGLFVLETFFVEPDLFDAYISISPSLWWNDRQLVRQASPWLRARPDLRKTLYLTSADESDIISGLELLKRTFEAGAPRGLAWSYHPMPDQFHDTIYRASSPKALRTVFAAKPATSP